MQTILLQAMNNGTSIILMYALIIGVIWLFFWRPNAKRQREQKDFLGNLEKGTEVVMSSGIIGRINKIEGEIVTLEISKQVFIRITKNAISKELTDALVSTPSKDQ